MPRKKTPGRIKSHPELLERISFEIGRAILDHLESPTTAKTSTTAIDRGIDYLKLNGFDTEALTKAQRQREALKRINAKGNDTDSTQPTDYDVGKADDPVFEAKLKESLSRIPKFDVPSIDPDLLERIGKRGKEFQEADQRTERPTAMIPDRTNQ